MRDFFGRELSYVRISVTDRCDYRCRYCMPGEGVEWIPHDRILSYEEILFLTGILCGLGVKKIRFTGGEPLVRKGMIKFLEKVTASFPALQVALTTNGSTLTQDAPYLARIGLASVNISLDTLDAGKFTSMTRGAALKPVLDGIDSLTALVSHAQTVIKMNTVLMRSFNDDGMIAQLTDFAFKNRILLRFIEFMPLTSNIWSTEMFMPFSEALVQLPGGASNWAEDKTGKNLSAGPARYYVSAVTGQRVGVITAVSQHFCESCNRLRVTSTGDVRPCLFNSGQISISEALRDRDEKKVRELLHEAANKKPESGAVRNKAEHHETTQCDKTRMHRIGG